MSDLESIINKNLTDIIDKTIVNVKLCAALKQREILGTAEHQILAKHQREGTHSDGATYLYLTIVPMLDTAGESSFVEALKESKNNKVVEILIREGFVMAGVNCPQELGTSSGTEKIEVKSAVTNNLLEIVKNTKITVELGLELLKRKLLLESEHEKLENYQRNGQHTEGATYLYRTVLPKFNEIQQLEFVKALAAAGNAQVVDIIRRNQQGGTNHEPNLSQTDGLICWRGKDPKKQAVRREVAGGQRFALIVNVVLDRLGVEADELRLSKTLQKCGFDVQIVKKKNRTKENLLREVKNFRISCEENPVNTIFVALMSHGCDNIMFQTEDRDIISIKEIIEEFSVEKSSSLENVPKVFLINMCRKDKRIVKPDSVNLDEQKTPFNWEDYWNRLFESSRREEGHVVKDEFDSEHHPTWKTFYFGFSTKEGTLSLRYQKSSKVVQETIGAWFVIDFCDVLENKIRNEEPTPIARIFEEATMKVKNRGDLGNFKGIQVPIHYSVGFDDHEKFLLP